MITRSSSSNDYTIQRVTAATTTMSLPSRSLSEPSVAKGPARGWSEYVPGVIKSERSILERCETRTRTYIHAYTQKGRKQKRESKSEKRDALVLLIRWKEEKKEEEEVGRQEALARDTWTRHTINTIFALPLHPIPPPHGSTPSIHPSIYPSRGAGMTEESERWRLYSLSMHSQGSTPYVGRE